MDPVQLEAAEFRRIQLTKYRFLYCLNVPVANNTTLPALLTIQEDADFKIEFITGNAYGPTDQAGIRQLAINTDFDLAGTTAGYADRGLVTRITDTGAGRELTSGFVPVEAFLSPGYGIALNEPLPFKYFVRRNSSFRFDIRNRDTTAGGYYHFLSIVLHGIKYAGQPA